MENYKQLLEEIALIREGISHVTSDEEEKYGKPLKRILVRLERMLLAGML